MTSRGRTATNPVAARTLSADSSVAGTSAAQTPLTEVPVAETASHQTWEVWACRADLTVGVPEALPAARVITDAIVDDITRAASRFEPDSELSRLNRLQGQWFSVSELFLDMVVVAMRAAAQSDGLVDPTIGGLVEQHGFARNSQTSPQTSPQPDRPHESPLVRRVVRSDWRSLEVDPVRARIRMPAGLQLDLGAIGKAYAADLIADSVNSALDVPVLVGLGGDLAAVGTDPEGPGWPVVVLERADDLTGQPINVTDGGIATSSTHARAQPGLELTHIVDPRTARPAVHHWRTVTVAAATCVEANTASTAAVIRGEGAIAWLRELGLPARLVDRHGHVVRVGAWPSE